MATRLRSGWLLIVIALLVVACRAGAPAPPTAVTPTPPASAAPPTPATAAEPTAAPTNTATAFGNSSEEGIMNGDNRSARLRTLTSGWRTDWTRRTIEYDEILSGGPPRDGIPSIDAPQFINFAAADDWLADNEPVVAVEIAGDARAYPLQILTWHEIVNDEVGGTPVIVTFCPLCNSAIVFDRRVSGATFEFGTSGLLRFSDLIMYDRTTESLWQQFTGEGIVGDMAGERLTFLPSAIISYANFKVAYPDGRILSRETGFERAYGRNPYIGYDAIGGNPFLFDGPVDGRLPAMARVVTLRFDDANLDVAYPLTTLAAAGVINDVQAGVALALFHLPGTSSALDTAAIADGADVGATGVFVRNVNGQTLTFSRDGEAFVDAETGSRWNIVGTAIDGPLAGTQLTRIVHADHFWFSWAAFRPATLIYEAQR